MKLVLVYSFTATLLSGCIELSDVAGKRMEVMGEAMEPTLQDGQRVWMKEIKDFDDLKRGDIIIFQSPDDRQFIKRVIGLPNDSIVIAKDKILVNGQQLVVPTIPEEGIFRGLGNYNVGDEYYFVISDNLNNGVDSRSIGPVHEGDILGIIEVE